MSRIFISYGRIDAEGLAVRLEAALRQDGHETWLDRREIKAGRAWEEEIEQGILASDVVVALLSPHAVRRPDGVCLDEISLARYNQKHIIPAMVIPCRPPLGIYRLDWIDFQDWEIPARYDRALARLTTSLRDPSPSVEGTNAAIFSRLKPMDFGNELARLNRGFIGRTWLFDQIEQWLHDEKSPVFLITGDPGVGKSAALAALVQRYPQVCAYHFCVADLLDSLDPFLFVKSMAAQLATQLDSYRAALAVLDLQPEGAADPGVLFRRLITDPLKSAALETPVVIVVDALDESLGYAGRNIARLLAERAKDLPPGLRIVASSRENADVLDVFGDCRRCSIQADDAENLGDASSFVALKFTQPEIAERLRGPGVSAWSVSETLLAKGRGNFLYLRYVLEALQAGHIDPADPNAFPDGLVGAYYAFFQRVFPSSEGYSTFRPLLDVITASREPMDASSIATILGMDAFDVQHELQRVSDFFPKREGRYQAFHKSIVDWLTGTAGRSVRFQVNLTRGHDVIASECWRQYERGAAAMSDYAVRHCLYHLQQVDRSGDEVTMMRNPGFIQRRLALGPGIFLSHGHRPTEFELVGHLVADLAARDHRLLTQVLTDSELEWRQQLAANIPSMSVVMGFTYTRNSPYLQEEWRMARANGVPLILVMAEDSPWLAGTAPLAGVPCFDMRQWRTAPETYRAALSQLLALIGDGTPGVPVSGGLNENFARPVPQRKGIRTSVTIVLGEQSFALGDVSIRGSKADSDEPSS